MCEAEPELIFFLPYSLLPTRLHLTLSSAPSYEPPGMAQHACLPCSRFFADALALGTHIKSKPHKRRLKKLEEDPYTIEESRAAAGMGVDKGEFTKRREEEKKAKELEKKEEMKVDS